jgi:2-phosphosulfolactate phosphatase
VSPFDQGSHRVRFDWGPNGLRNLLSGGVAVVVVVDVLSFTTAVDIAVGRGAVVFPYRWAPGEQGDDGAAAFASTRGAELARHRGSGGYSLAPSSLQTIPAGTGLVLPSPNGSALAFAAADSGAAVLAGCLRNAAAVGAAAQRLAGPAGSVGVLAAGERWRGSTGPLRVATCWGRGP